jgi:hypothetical protein
MRTTFILFLATAVCLVSAGTAQAQKMSDETTLTYQVLTEEWDTLIGGVLDLSDEEAEAFWPVYREYKAARGELLKERIDVIAMFLTGYDSMGDDIARGLLDASFEIDAKRLELKREYAEKFDDVLPLNKVVRLFQAENKLETTMMMEVAKDVPLSR